MSHSNPIRLLLIALALLTLSCVESSPESDEELLERYFEGYIVEPRAFYSVDKSYNGPLGSAHFVRASTGDKDTFLFVIGIRENEENDYALPLIAMPISIPDGRTGHYAEYMAGDSLYMLVGDNDFWLDSTVWNMAIDNAEPFGILRRCMK